MLNVLWSLVLISGKCRKVSSKIHKTILDNVAKEDTQIKNKVRTEGESKVNNLASVKYWIGYEIDEGIVAKKRHKMEVDKEGIGEK